MLASKCTRKWVNGYLEDVYQESLELELADRGISFIAQPKLPIYYKGRQLRISYEADLLVLDKIIVELKAVKTLLPEHEAQLLNYLKATGRKVGYLVNFGTYPKLSTGVAAYGDHFLSVSLSDHKWLSTSP